MAYRAVESAGIVLYRWTAEGLRVLIGHMGGPYWTSKEEGAWTIPKGEVEANETPLAAALREFKEEIGGELTGPFIPLTPVVQRSGKRVQAWAVEGDHDVGSIRSALFPLEWPPRSGRITYFAEIDRAKWAGVAEAARLVVPGQAALLLELEHILASRGRTGMDRK